MINLEKAIRQRYPDALAQQDYFILDRSDGDGPALFVWNLPDPPPSADEIPLLAAAYDAAEQRRQTDDTTQRTALRALARDAVGKPVAQLTAAEVRALLGLLLRKEGGLNPDTTVRPLADWAR